MPINILKKYIEFVNKPLCNDCIIFAVISDNTLT